MLCRALVQMDRKTYRLNLWVLQHAIHNRYLLLQRLVWQCLHLDVKHLPLCSTLYAAQAYRFLYDH